MEEERVPESRSCEPSTLHNTLEVGRSYLRYEGEAKGEMKSSASVRMKYIPTITQGVRSISCFAASVILPSEL